MARRLLVGMITIGLLAWPALASADSVSATCSAETKPLSSAYTEGDVLFTVRSAPGESLLIAEGRGMKFSKRLTAGRVRVQIDVPGDTFALDATPDGMARLTRNGKTLRIRMTTAGDETARVQRFLAGSKALVAFESLSLALESSTRAEARSVLTSFALVHAVRGSGAPARALANTVKAQQAAKTVRTSAKGGDQGINHCWTEFTGSLMIIVAEFDQCYQDYGWIPGMNAVCAFEFAVRAELAWFWVIACHGGMPT